MSTMTGTSAGELLEAADRLVLALHDCKWIVAGDRNTAFNAVARIQHIALIAKDHGEEATLRWQGGGSLG
jgi:hypothetical protein